MAPGFFVLTTLPPPFPRQKRRACSNNSDQMHLVACTSSINGLSRCNQQGAARMWMTRHAASPCITHLRHKPATPNALTPGMQGTAFVACGSKLSTQVTHCLIRCRAQRMPPRGASGCMGLSTAGRRSPRKAMPENCCSHAPPAGVSIRSSSDHIFLTYAGHPVGRAGHVRQKRRKHHPHASVAVGKACQLLVPRSYEEHACVFAYLQLMQALTSCTMSSSCSTWSLPTCGHPWQ